MKSLLRHYPVYRTFLNTIIKLIHEQWRFGVDIHKDFITCVHTNDEIVFKDYYADDYNNIVSDFYTQTYNLFHDKKIDANNPSTFLLIILDIVRSIRQAKVLNDIVDEQTLGQDILDSELPQSMITSIFSYFRPKNSTQNPDISFTKNRVSLFCFMLKKYNCSCNNKQTPHLLQHFYYQIKNDLQLALPDNYANCVFDEDKYAFIELDQLISDFQTLVYADDETVQQLVTQLYGLRK